MLVNLHALPDFCRLALLGFGVTGERVGDDRGNKIRYHLILSVRMISQGLFHKAVLRSGRAAAPLKQRRDTCSL
jgi:hypothetical protein